MTGRGLFVMETQLDILPKLAGVSRIDKYVPFSVKADDSDPGFRIVSGCATDPTIDHDKQMCDPSWLKTAMADYSTYSNIREMHQAIAAGIALSIIPENDAYYVTSRIVDSGSVKKLDAGVLKGYSIGIANPIVVRDNKAIGGRIIGGDIIEISLVDRPCNPAAMLDSVEVDKIEKVILWTKMENPISKFLDSSEYTDSQMLLAAADIVRRMMLRELSEGAEPGEPIAEHMSTLGTIYDNLLCVSREEATEAWADTAQSAIPPIVMTQTAQEVPMTDQVEETWEGIELPKAEAIKAMLPDIEKALNRGDRATITKAHDMLADLVKGDLCNNYITLFSTENKTEEADLTKDASEETETTEETVTEEAAAPTVESLVQDQNAALLAQLEAVQKKLAEVDEKLKFLGDQPDDSNAPILQTIQKNLYETRVAPEVARLQEREAALENTINTHPTPEIRGRAMAEIRKVRATLKEMTNV